MRRIILLGGMLLVAVGVLTLVFAVPKPVAAQHIDLVGAVEPINPTPLGKPRQNSPSPFIKPWQDLRDETALP